LWRHCKMYIRWYAKSSWKAMEDLHDPPDLISVNLFLWYAKRLCVCLTPYQLSMMTWNTEPVKTLHNLSKIPYRRFMTISCTSWILSELKMEFIVSICEVKKLLLVTFPLILI
jgi:hypothetical protein